MLKSILVVEDDPNDLDLMLVALERSQLADDIVITRDGSEALDYLFRRNDFAERPEGNPALILLDLKMPKIDGLGVLEVVRANEQLRSIPIVMLTSSKMEKDLACAYGLGVNAYVVKPLAFKEFVNAISNLGLFWAVINEPPPVSARVLGAHKS